MRDNPHPSSAPERHDPEADLGLLLYKTGRAIRDFFVWTGNGILRAGRWLLLVLLFLLKNIWWIAAGTAAGALYGVYLLQQNGTKFHAEMVVQTNFQSQRALYQAVEYVNSLIASGSHEELAALFDIEPAEARHLVAFSVEPVRTEAAAAALYDQRYLHPGRGPGRNSDTLWLQAMKYADFKRSLTKYDYPQHTVSAISTSRKLFGKLRHGLHKYLSGQELLVRLRDIRKQTHEYAEKLLDSSIRNLDSLQRSYRERIAASGQENPLAGPQLLLMDGKTTVQPPELEAFDKQVQLLNEWEQSRMLAAAEQEILPVLAPFNPVGRKLSFLRQSVTRFAIFGFTLSLVVLVTLSVYRSLLAFERSVYARKRRQAQHRDQPPS